MILDAVGLMFKIFAENLLGVKQFTQMQSRIISFRIVERIIL